MVSVMLISVHNMELTYELHKAFKLNFINARNNAVVVRRIPSTLHDTCIVSHSARTDATADCAFWYKPTTSGDRIKRCTADTHETRCII